MTTIDDSWYQRPPGALPERTSAGGVVVRIDGGGPWIGLAREGDYAQPVLPKGGVEPGEDLEAAAMREIEEEAGLSQLTLVQKLGVLERLSFDRALWVRTHVFLFRTEQLRGVPTDSERHLHGPVWRRLDHLEDMLWPDQRQLILRHQALIRSLGQ
ncbi:MAG: NUDIX domain-containing protein [Myxococcales bacterium]|nr:NUDIX domain-containing protein [Myxococcales bacterium]